jgi:hypothetical protein
MRERIEGIYLYLQSRELQAPHQTPEQGKLSPPLAPEDMWNAADDGAQTKEALVELFPGQKYPKSMHHATKPPKIVNSAREQAELGPDWSETYIYQPYPGWRYHWTKPAVIVKTAEEDKALGSGWSKSPAAFLPFTGARPARTDQQDPTKWIDKWAGTDLSLAHRTKIKVQLLRADASFWKSPDSDGADLTAMKLAFDGVAKVLFEAGILTERLLRNDIPILVWDSAIAGGWYRFASETPATIFPERLGHYWVWRAEGRDWNGAFRAETAEWLAALLEAPPQALSAATSGANSSPGPATAQAGYATSANAERPQTAPGPPVVAPTPQPELDDGVDFASEAGRNKGVAAYTKRWSKDQAICSEASLARTAHVHPSDLSRWKKTRLTAKSEKRARIERALEFDEEPTRPPLAP